MYRFYRFRSFYTSATLENALGLVTSSLNSGVFQTSQYLLFTRFPFRTKDRPFGSSDFITTKILSSPW